MIEESRTYYKPTICRPRVQLTVRVSGWRPAPPQEYVFLMIIEANDKEGVS